MKPKVKSKAYIQIKRLAAKYPDNEFLAISAAMTPPDHQTLDLGDYDELRQEALKEKYGI